MPRSGVRSPSAPPASYSSEATCNAIWLTICVNIDVIYINIYIENTHTQTIHLIYNVFHGDYRGMIRDQLWAIAGGAGASWPWPKATCRTLRPVASHHP